MKYVISGSDLDGEKDNNGFFKRIVTEFGPKMPCMLELAEKYSDIGFFKTIKKILKKHAVRIVLHIGANLILPGIGSALVEGFFALKKIHDIVKDL